MGLHCSFRANEYYAQSFQRRTCRCPTLTALQDLDFVHAGLGFCGTQGTSPCLIFRAGTPFPLCQYGRDTQRNLRHALHGHYDQSTRTVANRAHEPMGQACRFRNSQRVVAVFRSQDEFAHGSSCMFGLEE